MKVKKEERSAFFFSVLLSLIFITLFIVAVPACDDIDKQNVSRGKVELIVDKGDNAFFYFYPEKGEREILFVEDPLKSIIKDENKEEWEFRLKKSFTYQEHHPYRSVIKIIE